MCFPLSLLITRAIQKANASIWSQIGIANVKNAQEKQKVNEYESEIEGNVSDFLSQIVWGYTSVMNVICAVCVNANVNDLMDLQCLLPSL